MSLNDEKPVHALLGTIVRINDFESPLRLHAHGEEFREQKEFENAAICLRKAANLAKRQKQSLNVQCRIWISYGRVLLDLDQPLKSEHWLRKALKPAEEHGLSGSTRLSAYDALVDLMAATGRLDEARHYRECLMVLLKSLKAPQVGEIAASSEDARPKQPADRNKRSAAAASLVPYRPGQLSQMDPQAPGFHKIIVGHPEPRPDDQGFEQDVHNEA